MQRRDLVIGAGVLLVIIVIVLFIQSRRSDLSVPEDSPTPISMTEQEAMMEDKFNVDIPEDVDKANLQGVSGNGIATRDKNVVTMLVDLPDPDDGKFYQAWLTNGSDQKLLGRLRVAKGGYLIEGRVSGDVTSYNQVIVSLESVDDNVIESVVLRGSFN